MNATVTLQVADGTEMNVYTARPGRAASGNPPGVMVFQEAFGVNAHIRDVAGRLAALGYVAAAPELYHRTASGFEGDYNNFTSALPHMQAMKAEGNDADIRATHAWLTAQGCERVVAVGFCMGGRMAVRAAAAVPLAAAASFYGGGLPTLNDLVPQVQAPLLLVWGDRDNHIPPAVRAQFAGALREHKKPFVECTFSGAGHGFFCDQRDAYHAPSAHLAWGLLTDFLANPAS